MKRGKNSLFYVGFTLLAIVEALYLEIYKNTLWGWGIAILLFAGYFYLRKKWLSDKKWYHRLAAVAVMLALLLGNHWISRPPYRQISAVEQKNPKTTDVVTVEQGQLQGVMSEDEQVEVFAGIPYAKPPVGELRWKEPQDPEDWEGVKICDTFAPMSMQKEGDPIYTAGSQIVGYHNFKITPKDNYKEARSEDSLYLNIWRPANVKEDEDLPVLVYIHGGSLNSGQSYYGDYNGESLAKQGIIVVTITYRLGVFGYFAHEALAEESHNHTTGNYGLLDQIQALKWVNANIESFGGDVNNITIAGESAGSSSVNAICVSPLSKGLFRRAVAESSGIVPVEPFHTFRTMEAAKEVGNSIMEEFSCTSIDELRDIPAEQLVETAYANNEMTVDGYAITEQPYLTYEKGENHEEAVLGGYNANEAYVFLMFSNHVTKDTYAEVLEDRFGKVAAEKMMQLYPANTDEEAKENYNEIMGLAWFGYSHYKWSEYMTQQERPAYLYYFNKENAGIGTWHAGEMPYLYGNLHRNGVAYDEEDYQLSEAMQTYLVQYVKTGDPNGGDVPLWKTYKDDSKQVMSFGNTLGMVDQKHIAFFQIIDEYMEGKKE